jgi:hypothetical protein
LDGDVLHALLLPANAAGSLLKKKGTGNRGKIWKFLEDDVRRIRPGKVGKPGQQTVAKIKGATSAPQAAARTPAEPSAQTPSAALGAPSKYVGHVKKSYTTGRKADPLRESVLEYCYDEYIGKGRSRKEVWDDARSRFGPSSPMTRDEVKDFAWEWAKRFAPPLPTARDGGN